MDEETMRLLSDKRAEEGMKMYINSLPIPLESDIDKFKLNIAKARSLMYLSARVGDYTFTGINSSIPIKTINDFTQLINSATRVGFGMYFVLTEQPLVVSMTAFEDYCRNRTIRFLNMMNRERLASQFNCQKKLFWRVALLSDLPENLIFKMCMTLKRTSFLRFLDQEFPF